MQLSATPYIPSAQDEGQCSARSGTSSLCPFDGRTSRIPGPKALPVIGNILDLDLKAPYSSFLEIQKQYGAIFQMTFAGKREISVCTRELADLMCDETRFHKLVSSGVATLRQVVEDALFTAHHGSRQWDITHRILKPIFGPLKIRDMFDEMKDVSEQLCLKWARHGSAASIDVAADYTRLTLDTISLCMMDYRFNSFYLDGKHHPFVEHMVSILSEADIQAMLPDWAGFFRPRAMAKFKKDIKLMTDLCRGMVEHRRKNPVARKDFLNAMLLNRDPVTGEKLDDDEIVRNLITFLVAGHETTSGMLSFATYYLLANPDTLARAQEEIDRVVGTESVAVHHLQDMPYMDAVFREALRLMPTAVAFYVTPYKPELIMDKYLVHPGEAICLLLDPIHRDPAVYGDDADQWKPERMLQEEFDKLPPNSWKPFGNGSRICLGMAFTWQEAKLAMAMILQNFDLSQDDPGYKLKIKHLLTIKPEGFNIRAKLRHNRTGTEFHKSLRKAAAASEEPVLAQANVPTVASTKGSMPMTILYGSDTGTCEALAQRMAVDASARGFAPKVAELNTAVGRLPKGEPVVVICATYHGKAAANAADFVAWVEALQPGELQGVQCAVLGLGHSDWTTTFYTIPTLLDARFERAGAKRLAPLGKINTAKVDVFSALESWTKAHLWQAVAFQGQQVVEAAQDTLTVTLDSAGAVSTSPMPMPMRRKGFTLATVTEARTLTSPGVAQKGHLELTFPHGHDAADPTTTTALYEPGFHVQVLPSNDASIVQRALSRFQLRSDNVISLRRIEGAAPTQGLLPLPEDGAPLSLTASDLFKTFFDLDRAISPSNLELLISAATDQEAKRKLEAIQAEMYQQTQDGSSACEASFLDILEQFPPSCVPLPLSTFLSSLPPMMPRTYSFSSSPAYMQQQRLPHKSEEDDSNNGPSSRHATVGTLTYGVIDRQKPGARNKGRGSNYLASLQPGDVVHVSVAPNQHLSSSFRLPGSPDKTPIVMIAAGTGISPFMGFVQQRAFYKMNAASDHGQKTLAPAMLFFGCRGRELDDLYHEELDSFERDGLVQVRRAYSRDDKEYVGDRVRAGKEEIMGLWDRGAVVYVCGHKKVADAVLSVLKPLLLEAERRNVRMAAGVEDEEGWAEVIADERLRVEVFA